MYPEEFPQYLQETHNAHCAHAHPVVFEQFLGAENLLATKIFANNCVAHVFIPVLNGQSGKDTTGFPQCICNVFVYLAQIESAGRFKLNI